MTQEPKQNIAPPVQQQAVQQSSPVISVPSMDPPARFQDPAAPPIPDERSFRGDPELMNAAQRGVAPPSSATRSDYQPQFMTLDDVEPSVAQEQQSGTGPVIPQQSRYMEVPDERVNDLGFRRMVDRGQVNSDSNHAGIYTNLDGSTFNKAMNDHNGNVATGGSFETAPSAQMNAELFSRRITGKLPSGGTYEYFLKPGQLTGAQEYALQEKQAQQNAMQKFDGSLHSAQARQAHEAARKQNLSNRLAEHFMDTDPELAASMLGFSHSGGVLPEWNVGSQKQYDSYGNVTGENQYFYKGDTNGQLDVIPLEEIKNMHRKTPIPPPPIPANQEQHPKEPLRSQMPLNHQTPKSQQSAMYRQAFSKVLSGSLTQPGKLTEGMDMLTKHYPNQFSEADRNLLTTVVGRLAHE